MKYRYHRKCPVCRSIETGYVEYPSTYLCSACGAHFEWQGYKTQYFDPSLDNWNAICIVENDGIFFERVNRE